MTTLVLLLVLAADPVPGAPPALAATPEVSYAPGGGVNPARVELLQVATESQVPHTYSIERPTGAESTIEVAIEFDSDRFGLVVALADPAMKVKVEQRHETSLTVQDDGPHLDLVDWKHHVSDWTELPGSDGGTFRSLPISEEDSLRFPRVELSTVLAELERRDPRWFEVAKRARSIGEYPLGVAVSELTFRILALVGGRWVPVHVVHLRRPMGC